MSQDNDLSTLCRSPKHLLTDFENTRLENVERKRKDKLDTWYDWRHLEIVSDQFEMSLQLIRHLSVHHNLLEALEVQ